MEGKIFPVGMDEEERVIAFLNKNFVPDEPLNRSQGVTKGFQSPLDMLTSDMCLKMESDTGDLMGVVLNVVENDLPQDKVKSENEDGESTCPASHDPEFIPVLRFLNHVDSLVPIKDKEGIMHIHIVAVDGSWRNQGIGRRLMEASVKLARDRGVPGVQVNCSNHYTSRMVEKIPEFRKILSVPYDSYLDPCGQPVFRIPPPHDAMHVYHMSL
nr:PREDICTED: uncharacterized protein LOC109030928 [Bemisia tabaci]